MNAGAIRVLMDYNAWAHARVWQCVSKLTDEQFVQENDYSLGSIRNHLVHVVSVDARWFARLRNTRLPDRLNPEDFPTREDVSRLWSVVYHDLDLVLEHLTDEQVSDPVTYDVRGETFTQFGWKILLHVVNHGTDHRAQMLYALHKLGVDTVEQDFVYYLRDELPPRGYIKVRADILRLLFDYDAYATSRLVSECMSNLTEAELDHEFGYAHGTLRRQLGHILQGGQYWLGRAFGETIDDSAGGTFNAARRYASSLTDPMLMEPVEYKNPHGASFANIRWEMLWHLVNHGTDHRAQTLAMLHELDAPTFEQDLMYYLWDYVPDDETNSDD